MYGLRRVVFQHLVYQTWPFLPSQDAVACWAAGWEEEGMVLDC